MSTVRVSCLLCSSTVEVAPRDVVLHLDGADAGTTNRYGFSCPACAVFVVRPAGPAVVEALLATDVELSTGSRAPWEASSLVEHAVIDVTTVEHPRRDPDLPPLTPADLATFVDILADDDALAVWLTD